MKPFVLSPSILLRTCLSKHEWLHGLRQAQAERNEISIRAEFITALGQYKVSSFQYTAEEVLEDLANAS